MNYVVRFSAHTWNHFLSTQNVNLYVGLLLVWQMLQSFMIPGQDFCTILVASAVGNLSERNGRRRRRRRKREEWNPRMVLMGSAPATPWLIIRCNFPTEMDFVLAADYTYKYENRQACCLASRSFHHYTHELTSSEVLRAAIYRLPWLWVQISSNVIGKRNLKIIASWAHQSEITIKSSFFSR